MFQSAYQDGDCVEVFSPAGKNPGSEWKSSGKIVRVYEKGVKGYVCFVRVSRIVLLYPVLHLRMVFRVFIIWR